MEIKENLYAEIDKIGKSHIRTHLTRDLSYSKTLINLLINNCSNLLNKDNFYEDEFVSFGEALLHFVLTMSMIPAERKIIIDNVEVDIIVPNSKNLKVDNDKAIIIHFFKNKNENIYELIEKLSKVQKNTNNIWIVCSTKIHINLATFIVSPYLSTNTTTNNNSKFSYPFSDILIQIDEFLKKINYSGLKIF